MQRQKFSQRIIIRIFYRERKMIQRKKVLECSDVQVRIGHGDSSTANDTIKLKEC